MPLTHRNIAVVGSRQFKNPKQLRRILDEVVEEDDWLVSGGAEGADSMADRWARDNGRTIITHYPLWRPKGGYDAGAGFKRNKKIAEDADLVLAFYAKGHFQEGGTLNTANWARKLNKELREFEEE